MIRDIERLSATRFDVLVVGAGVHGAFIAWDAALRGLRVALIDANDLGGATSANSLKVIHGGLRYLQQINLKRVVESIRERAVWLSLAPSLVRPMPFMVPTRGHGKEGRAALAAALLLNDLFSASANGDLPSEQRIARGRVVDRHAVLRMAPPLESVPLDGGAIWCDAHASNTERLTLGVVLAAAECGATVANYVRCEEVRAEKGRVVGARVHDVVKDASMDVTAVTIVNATGGDLRVAGESHRTRANAPARALAVNLITRPIPQTVAFGVRSPRTSEEDPIGGGRRYLFFVPWRSSSLIGTFYRPWADGETPRASAELVDSIVAECNDACPGLDLTREDVRRTHAGLLPIENASRGRNATHARASTAPLLRRARIVEEWAHGGPRGLISVFGIKYTTARLVAEQTVNVIYRTLGLSAPPCRTASMARALDTSSTAPAVSGPLLQGTDEVPERLREVYGTRAPAVVAGAQAVDSRACEPLGPGCHVLRAEVVHAIKSEMAVRLSDVVFRRTDLASEMAPADAALTAAAELTGALLGWSDAMREAEIAAVRAAFQL